MFILYWLKGCFAFAAFIILYFVPLSFAGNLDNSFQWEGIQLQTSVQNINDEIRVIQTILNVNIQGCIKHCQQRQICQFISYHTRSNMCFLIEKLSESFSDENIVTAANFVFGFKSAWNEVFPSCNVCSEREVCSIAEDGGKVCTVKECAKPPVLADAQWIGNKFTVGSRLLYRCTNVMITTTVVCQTNGMWSAFDMTCQIFQESNETLITSTPSTTLGQTATPTTTTGQTSTPTTAIGQTTTSTTTMEQTSTPTTTTGQTTSPTTTKGQTTTPTTTTGQTTTSLTIIEQTTTATTTTEQTTVPASLPICPIDTTGQTSSYESIRLSAGTDFQYLVVTESVTQSNALLCCTQSYDGSLVKMLTAAKMNFMMEYLNDRDYGADIWIDANYIDGVWLTSDEQIVLNEGNYWTDTGLDGDNDEACTRMSRNADFKLNDKECTYQYAFICEKTTQTTTPPITTGQTTTLITTTRQTITPTTCPIDTIGQSFTYNSVSQSDGLQFQLLIVNEPVTQANALLCCTQRYNGSLVKILTAEKMIYLMDFLNDTFRNYDFWIDANYIDGVWLTSDEQIVLSESHYWNGGGGINGANGKVCTRMVNWADFKLDDKECTYQCAFICEKTTEQTTTLTTTTRQTLTPPTCPINTAGQTFTYNSVMLNDGQQFRFLVVNKSVTQFNASLCCIQSYDGSLVKILTAVKMDVLITHLKAQDSDDSYWIDARKIEGLWETSDGDAVLSEDTGYWDNIHTSDSALCTRMQHSNNYYLNDIQCDQLFSFICEKSENTITNS